VTVKLARKIREVEDETKVNEIEHVHLAPSLLESDLFPIGLLGIGFVNFSQGGQERSGRIECLFAAISRVRIQISKSQGVDDSPEGGVRFQSCPSPPGRSCSEPSTCTSNYM